MYSLALVGLLVSLQSIAQTNPPGTYLPAGIPLVPPGFNRNDPFTTGNWKLVFSDEFEQDNYLDPAKWVTYEPGPTWGGPPTSFLSRDNGLAMYKDENVKVKNGSCVLTLKPEACDWTGEIGRDANNNPIMKTHHYDYSSAVLASKVNKQMFERGMFEARIAMGKGHFAHQTFWTWPMNEIDIVEFAPYKGRKKAEMNLHNNYYGMYDPAGAQLGTCEAKDGVGKNLDEDFHVYTGIWDKNYIYIYVDHQLKKIYSRFWYNNYDDFNQKFEDFSYPDATKAGYYWPKECFMQLNHAVYMMLTNSIDPRGEGGGANPWLNQAKGLPSEMWIDWVRVYQRYECDEDPDLRSGKLFPYEQLSSQYFNYSPPGWTVHNHVTLGTQSAAGWDNIVSNWEIGSYKAKVIDILPNFQSYPVWHSPDGNNAFYSGHEFVAMRDCPITDMPGYIMPERLRSEDTTEDPDTPFDCSSLDTTEINTVIASGNTDSIARLFYLLDSAHCTDMITYLNTRSSSGNGGASKATFHPGQSMTYASVYPNPARDEAVLLLRLSAPTSVSVQMTDMSGRVVNVITGQYISGNQRFIIVTKDLAAGVYYLHIKAGEQSLMQKLSVVK